MSDHRAALVACYSPVGSDARVSNQIRWLKSAGYRVDVLSTGPAHPDASGRQFRIARPPLWRRLALYLFAPLRVRYARLIRRGVPLNEVLEQRYDLVVVNDLELAPWFVEFGRQITDGDIVLDLHEVYSGNGTSLFYRALIARFDEWLLEFISSPVFSKRLTVAEGIADLYRDRYALPRPGVIRNVAPYEDLSPTPVDPERVLLVHHGYAAVERGIDIMLDAALELEPRFTLVLMVLGDARALAPLKAHPAVSAGRAQFREPVGVTEVARALNDCDLELIFFPPRFANNTYALPNKFFEAIQARLGVVIGESPEIVEFVREHGFGTVVSGWSSADLARSINALTTRQITSMKDAAHRSAAEFSTRGERVRFLSELGIEPLDEVDG